MTGRSLPPFYCPYCGEERIRPVGSSTGEWTCELCRRAWTLTPLSGAAGAEAASGSRDRPVDGGTEVGR